MSMFIITYIVSWQYLNQKKKTHKNNTQTQYQKPYHKKTKIPGRRSNRWNLGVGREAAAGERNMSQEAVFQSKGEKPDKN